MDPKTGALEAVPAINISRFIEVLPLLYRVKEVPVLLISHTGIGKTQSIEHFCNKSNLAYKNIRLAYIEAQDIVGFPQIKEDKMVYIQPDFLPSDPQSRGILFFDEINRARIDVLQAVFQLILERELGVGNAEGENYKLPPDWFIIAAKNPDTEDYYVSPMDSALYNRFLIIPIEFHDLDFKDYIGSADYFMQDFANFILESSTLKLNKSSLRTISINPTPRSFDLFNKIYSKLLPGEYHLLDIIGNGLIGQTNFQAFSRYRLNKDKEIENLLQQVLRGEFEKEDRQKEISKLEKDKLEIILGMTDRFVERKIKINTEYQTMKNKELSYFMNFIFELSNELIVSTLLGVRKGLEKQNNGPAYIPDIILNIIEKTPNLKKKYNQITEQNKDLKLEEFI